MNQDWKHYQNLLKISRETAILKGISNLLEWDQQTYMPQGAITIRAQQFELLARLEYKGATSKTFSTALNKLIDLDTGEILAKSLAAPYQRALIEWRKDYRKKILLPQSFIQSFISLVTQAKHAWALARENNDFRSFAPFLKQIVQMCRKKADLLGYEDHPYDALINEYEPEVTTKDVIKIFTNLKKPIIPLLKEINRYPKIDNSFLDQYISQENQIDFSEYMLKTIGYDSFHGRLDKSVHPFSISINPVDCRIAIRNSPVEFMKNIDALLHEAGHSLYDLGLPTDHFGSPLAESISVGIHESQSRWWETRVGKSKPFWSYFYPIMQRKFQPALSHISFEEFYRGINRVEPSSIRIEADEVTYLLHVNLRIELEYAMIEGDLAVEDLPEAWNAKMQEYLGITPSNDREGCLQDIHWSMGAFGYFPTYLLGNLYAAHFFAAFAKANPNWGARLEKGDLTFMLDWLRQEIHQHGRRYSAKELVNNINGELTVDTYAKYLQEKYADVYNIAPERLAKVMNM